jgi:hypothetical protein
LGRLSECSLFLSLFSVSLCLSFVLCSFFRLAGNLYIPAIKFRQSYQYWVDWRYKWVFFVSYF